eukprot:15453391-Alexandrium_andersonii.AAC.1
MDEAKGDQESKGSQSTLQWATVPDLSEFLTVDEMGIDVRGASSVEFSEGAQGPSAGGQGLGGEG